MIEEKQSENLKEIERSEVDFEEVADEKKREFMKKYGKFAATAPAMGFLLMTLGTSKAHAGSDGAP